MSKYSYPDGAPVGKGDVIAAVRHILQTAHSTALAMTRYFGWHYSKSFTIIELLEDAKVISLADTKGSNARTILLKNESAAINAALRQLRKGRRTK